MNMAAPNAAVTKVPRESDPDTPARKDRLRAICKARGWRDEAADRWRVKEIAQAIGSTPQQVSNWLSEGMAFGAPAARKVEDALGLARCALDGAQEWPFTQALLRTVESLDAQDRAFAENALRAHLKMQPIPIPPGGSVSVEDKEIRHGKKAA